MPRQIGFLLVVCSVLFTSATRSVAEEQPNDNDPELQRFLSEWQDRAPQAFAYSFHRWDYDYDFGPKDKGYLGSEAAGVIRRTEEGHRQFAIQSRKHFDLHKNAYIELPDAQEEWRWDREAIYEFDYRRKQLIEHRLPVAEVQWNWLQRALFFYVAGDYVNWMTDPRFICERATFQIITPESAKEGDVWLEACPTKAHGRACFDKIEIIVDSHDFRIKAVQFYQPGGNTRSACVFSPLVETPGENECTFPPVTPSGWKRIIDESPNSPNSPTK